MSTFKSCFICLCVFLGLLAIEATGQTNWNTTLIGRWAEGTCYATAAAGNVVYVGNGGYLEIVDFTDPLNPIELGKVLTPSVVQDIAVSGNYAYVADKFAGLRVIDVSNPADPVEAGFLEIGDRAQAIAVMGSYAYLACELYGLYIIDISNPANPIEAGFWSITGSSSPNVAVSGHYVYLTTGGSLGLRVIDVSDPANPFEAGVLEITGSNFRDVALSGNYAYVADSYFGMRVIDVSDPANPIEVANISTGAYHPAYITLNNNYAYLAQVGLQVIDISDPAAPTQIGQITLVDFQPRGVTISGSYAYIADWHHGVRVINVSNPAIPVVVGFFDTGAPVLDLAINNGHAFLGVIGGVEIIDVSDLAHPVKVGHFETLSAISVAVDNNYLYANTGSHAFLVIDISDPANPIEVGYCQIGSAATEMVISGVNAYISSQLLNDSLGRLQIVDISNPTNPSVIGDLQLPDLAMDVAVKGSYAYVSAGDAGLRVINISDPLNPIEVGYFSTTTFARGVAVSSHYAYVTSSPGLQIIDISDPANPMGAGFFSTLLPTEDVAVSGSYIYFTSQWYGIRIVDVSDPANPLEAGFYNTGDYANNVEVIGNHAYVADAEDGLYIISNDLVYRPVITRISDIPGDQGKQVRVSWVKSSLDGIVAGDSAIVEYSLWRRIDESPLNEMNRVDEYLKLASDSLPAGEWDFILTVPAIGNETYNVVALTLADSNHVHGMHWSCFVVIAHAVNPLMFFVSDPDSGYSLDNLIPQAPGELLAVAGDSLIDLRWKMVPDEDFNYYAIYRSIQSGFDPDTLQPYATTIDTFFTDMIVEPNTNYYYRVSAFDFSGNEGNFSEEVSAVIVGINDATPVLGTYALFQNFPNPFNPATTIMYQIPKTEHITLCIYNVLGQLVETIVDTKQVPGSYAVQWNAAKVESGIYFYRLKAGNFVETKKLLLLK